jgi:hypothetical protein
MRQLLFLNGLEVRFFKCHLWPDYQIRQKAVGLNFLYFIVLLPNKKKATLAPGA